MQSIDPSEWSAIMDGDALEYDGSEPAVLTLRPFGRAGVYLERDGLAPLLVGVGDSEEFTVTVRTENPCQLRVQLQHLDLPAAFKTRGQAHTQPDLAGSESLVVIKPHIQESEEMRLMRRVLQQQAQQHERQLRELQDAGRLDRRATSGGARVPDPDGAPVGNPASLPDAGTGQPVTD